MSTILFLFFIYYIIGFIWTFFSWNYNRSVGLEVKLPVWQWLLVPLLWPYYMILTFILFTR